MKLAHSIPFAFLAFISACTYNVHDGTIFGNTPLLKKDTTLQDLIVDVDDYRLGIRTNFGWEKSSGADTIIIIFHGNAGNVGTSPWSELFEKLSLLNFKVVSLDYPGFGLSDGNPSIFNMQDSSLQLIEKMYSLSILQFSDNVILYGASLGSYPAIELASLSRFGINGLILDSPISSIESMVNHVKSSNDLFSLFQFLISENIHFNNVDSIAKVSIPVMYIHGLNDQSLPASMSVELSFETQKIYDFWLPEGVNHLNAFSKLPDEFDLRIEQFANFIQR